MKFSFKQDFCIWLVPSHGGGRVRKFRFSLRSVAVVTLCAMFIGATVMYVAGDYTRVQLMRLTNYVMLQRVLAERDKLLSRADSMESELGSLRDLHTSNEEREKKIRDRLNALSKVLKGSPFLGLNTQGSDKAQAGKGGMGGAEIGCGGKDREKCRLMADEDGDGSPDSPSFAFLQRDISSATGGELLDLLDEYVVALRFIPLGSPVDSTVTSGFGYRMSPFHGGITMHEGMDFDLRIGSRIFSTAHGIVKEVSYTRTYGLMVDVLHTNNILTRYAHMSRALVREGMPVRRGDVIGFSGTSGRSTGPHLHYEVRVDDVARNPARFIALTDRLSDAFNQG